MNRNDALQSLRDNPDVSVLIIGGGINGVGTFRDLALQGIDVVLVERNDFGSGTSSASSHMVHGGIRYLENGEFRLVRESVRERNRLIRNAPQYVKPLATTIPIFKWRTGLLNAPLKFLNVLDRPSERGAMVIKAGLIMYDAYTQDDAVPKHDFVMRKESLKRYPDLNREIVCTATYFDAAMPSPERILLEVLNDGLLEGSHARAINYAPVIGFEDGQVVVRDEVAGDELRIRPKLVINAAGPWIDNVNGNLKKETNFIGGTKGSHVVIDNPALRNALRDHEFFFENEDGRIVLIYPLQDKVMLGTSDIRIEDADDARCTEEEIDYFFNLVDRVFPDIDVNRDQIVHRFSGVRPLPSSDAKTTGQVSRDHSNRVIEPDTSPNGSTGADGKSFAIFNLIGGKWTTFRAFSEQVTDKALSRIDASRRESTAQLPIGGGRDYPNEHEATAWVKAVAAETDVAEAWVQIWFDRYGTRAQELARFVSDQVSADSPLQHNPKYSKHEIVWLTRGEMVVRLPDLLLRRTLIGMLGETTGQLLEEVAAIVGEVLGWDEAQISAEIEHTQTLFADRYQPIRPE